MWFRESSERDVSFFFFVILISVSCLAASGWSAPYLRVDTAAGVSVATYGGTYLEGQNDNTVAATAVIGPLYQDSGIVATQNYLAGLGTGQAKAQADYGVLRAWAKATGCEPTIIEVDGVMTTCIAGGNACSTAEFYDLITVSSPGVSGSGRIIFGVHVDGDMTGIILHPGVVSGAGWEIKFNGGTIADQWDYSTNSGLFGGDFTVSMPIAFGQGTNFSFSLMAAANGYYYNTLSIADYFNSAYITGLWVQDSAGNTLSNFTAVSASGHNYVPEPMTICLFGLGAMGMIRRKEIK